MAKAGLAGVMAAQTTISHIDGQRGAVYYRGYDLRDLVKYSNFEEVVYLLWFGTLPTNEEHTEFCDRLRGMMGLPKPLISSLFRLSQRFLPMQALRTAISELALYDPEPALGTPESDIAQAMFLMAHTPEIIAATNRLRDGCWPLQPRPQGKFAGNFLWLCRAAEPQPIEVRAMDTCLMLHAEHGLSASTFAARVTASTQADMHAGVTAAVGALSGPLHGGANQGVMTMFESISEPENAEVYVKQLLADGQRIMGFGHRIYEAVDPRSTILSHMAQELCEHTDSMLYYDIAECVREVTHAETGLYPNINFYSSLVLRALGIQTVLFPTIFATARLAGWAAHVMEQHQANRLIRPTSDYIGPQRRPFVPRTQRER